ncbi:CG6108 [Drosophila busckii]|uniref:CG6108 n=1 Tax=Drosophila busckii TaxID=30019 RepID=A0A0M4ERU5_DROBS|nr:CG6108 [Drosophila busckii]
MPPPPAGHTAAPDGAQLPPWPYWPPPPPPPANAAGKQPEGFAPYPYYYPYYLPPPPAYGQTAGNADAPAFVPPPYAYPYPVAPSYSQSSTESRASSVLPDIIITPSTDDMPSQVIMQHHIKVEPREPPKRAHSVEIEELTSSAKTRNVCKNQQQVIDVLSQRLANINNIAAGHTQANLSKQLQKQYAGEQSKELGARSPTENNEQSSDEETDTPKHVEAPKPAPLQSIKSVNNVQIYQQLDSESEDDDDDVTTAEEMSDEEEQEPEYIVEEDLSTIYEEESELERSSEYAKTVIEVEENDDDDEDEESNSVTVRLPLRFSFSRSSNDENIATVQVGSSTQIEERRGSLENKRNSFSIAKLEDDAEDDCEVSVTISLSNSNSSRSNSVEKHTTPRKKSQEDVAASFSMGMRNKFAREPLAEEKEKETAAAPEEFDFFATLMATKAQAQKMLEQSKLMWKSSEQPADEIKLRAKETETKVKRPLSMDVSKLQEETLKLRVKDAQSKPTRPLSADMSKTQATLEAAKNSFWSTFATAGKQQEIEQQDADCSASINEVKEQSQCSKKKKTVSYTPLQKETVAKVEHWATTLRAQVSVLPQAQRAEMEFIKEQTPVEGQKIVEEVEEEEVDFWATMEQDKSVAAAKPAVEPDFWAERESTPEPKPQAQTADEMDFWAEVNSANNSPNEEYAYDPTKYPEEPREVDTDEEIDFWAEIEAKRQPDDDDDVTFHKSATFWARKDRQNSVDETPYKPVETKAFRAKLPDEPAVEIDVWSTLQAARGEEPVLVDPVLEQEQLLAEQYEELEHEKEQQVEQPVEEHREQTNLTEMETMSLASMHEPLTVHTWTASNYDEQPAQLQAAAEEGEAEEETDFWADMEQERSRKEQQEEAELKRQNYRQAMAFFNTSIDEQKVEKTTSQRNSALLQTAESIDLGPPGEYELVGEDGEIMEAYNKQQQDEQAAEEEAERAAVTPTNLPEVYIEAETEPEAEPETPSKPKLLSNGLPDLGLVETPKISVRDRINVFETTPAKTLGTHSLSVDSGHGKGQLSRNSSTQRSESEIEEDDSGVTDMNRQLSETDTESESFPELRKMTSYQRAATHSRLFKLLQDENDLPEAALAAQADEFQFKPSRRKIVHNVSITRRQNPNALSEAETMTQRRERLSLPLCKNTSIDADNPSTPNSPASPIVCPSPSKQRVVSDKLVNELVQSLLLKSDSTHLRQLPMEKLQAAAKRALVEEMDSLENSSLDSTPALTPKQDKEYSDYYNSWTDANGSGDEIVPSKAFRALQDPRRSPWTVRCPRVLSSKTINRDLARVTESPEIANSRGSKSPECFRQQSRERSSSSWRKL